jgi:hypothetical protein
MMKSVHEPDSDAHVKRKRLLGSGKGDGSESTSVVFDGIINIV